MIKIDLELNVNNVIAAVLVVTGIVLTVTGFFVEPLGEVSDSVLIGTGEFLSFGGALLGVESHFSRKIDKLKGGEK